MCRVEAGLHRGNGGSGEIASRVRENAGGENGRLAR